MIQIFINNLIENIPFDANASPARLDIVIEGGAFNGSYLVGTLLFLKEMERRKMIIIERISGCSVGSILAFLYFIDALELAPDLYTVLLDDFKKNYNLSTIKKLKTYIIHKIPDDICAKIENKLFISYINVIKCEKIVKSKYKTVDHIINTIIKSCFIPIFIDSKLCYKQKYMDGVYPYIFPLQKDKKVLYLDIMSFDKAINIINIKNENSNLHRIISGVLDVHFFFIKNKQTPFCSYVNDWTILNKANSISKKLFEKVATYFVYCIICIKNCLPKELESTAFYKKCIKNFNLYYIWLIDKYFI